MISQNDERKNKTKRGALKETQKQHLIPHIIKISATLFGYSDSMFVITEVFKFGSSKMWDLSWQITVRWDHRRNQSMGISTWNIYCIHFFKTLKIPPTKQNTLTRNSYFLRFCGEMESKWEKWHLNLYFVQVNLTREIFTKNLYWSGPLGVANLLVSLFKGLSFKTLPR